jgi:hypothetical protein
LEETIRKARYCYERFGSKTRPRTRRRGLVRDFGRRGLNPQDLRNMEKILEGAFLLQVYIRKIPPIKVEINLLRQSQKRLIP